GCGCGGLPGVMDAAREGVSEPIAGRRGGAACLPPAGAEGMVQTAVPRTGRHLQAPAPASRGGSCPAPPPPLAGEGWGGGGKSRRPSPIPAFPRKRGIVSDRKSVV